MAQHGRMRGQLSVGLLGCAAAGVIAMLVLATGPTVAGARATGADAGAMLAAVALAAAWVLAVRLAVTALAVGLSSLPGFVGRAGSRLALAWSPRFARGLVRAALGISVAAGPLLSGAAAFADQPVLPQLDRVVSAASTTGPVTSATPAAPVPPSSSGSPAHPSRTTEPTAASGSRVVVVRAGDTLWGIAARALPPGHSDADVARAWPKWYAANRGVIGSDPGEIRPGQRLVAPG